MCSREKLRISREIASTNEHLFIHKISQIQPMQMWSRIEAAALWKSHQTIPNKTKQKPELKLNSFYIRLCLYIQLGMEKEATTWWERWWWCCRKKLVRWREKTVYFKAKNWCYFCKEFPILSSFRLSEDDDGIWVIIMIIDIFHCKYYP